MSFQLIDSGWQQVMDDALKTHPAELRVVCPFIKLGAAKGLLAHGKPKAIRVITRFNLDEFSLGVSDISALEYLRQNGAEIRGVKHLHAKVYLFGTGRAIATSANLTTAGLTRQPRVRVHDRRRRDHRHLRALLRHPLAESWGKPHHRDARLLGSQSGPLLNPPGRSHTCSVSAMRAWTWALVPPSTRAPARCPPTRRRNGSSSSSG